MRIVIHGVGAIGGSIGALLYRAGYDVVGIARGDHLDTIRRSGLRLRAQGIDEAIPLPVVAHPSELTFGAEDMILLCMKTQHSLPAMHDLRGAGVLKQPVFCFQNGVTNEDMALRLFPNVHGVTVMMPATFVKAGEVICHGAPKFGLFDIGRFPAGADAADVALADALTAAGMQGEVFESVMPSKYGKLLLNLGNIVQAALGRGAETGDLLIRLRDEARAVFQAAGIVWESRDAGDARRGSLMKAVDLPGVARQGGSSAQSLLRGADSIETDYLNGEVVRLGRLHGVPTPWNAAMMSVASHLLATGHKPGQMSPEDFLRLVDQVRDSS